MRLGLIRLHKRFTHLLCMKRWLNFPGASATSRHTKNTRIFTEDANRSYGKVRQPFRLLSRSTLSSVSEFQGNCFSRTNRHFPFFPEKNKAVLFMKIAKTSPWATHGNEMQSHSRRVFHGGITLEVSGQHEVSLMQIGLYFKSDSRWVDCQCSKHTFAINLISFRDDEKTRHFQVFNVLEMETESSHYENTYFT